ncbi:MAG TPA: TonB-dependent receptor [Terriglobales bacterium]|nr:TonB-dependent receptor [Terriglobales bacterium]
MRTPSLVLPLFVLSLAAALLAQDASTGALRGTVTDASGARIAGAEVRLISAQTGVERVTATAQEGSFVFAMLAPGEYGLQVSAPDMASLRRYGLQVEVGGAVELALALEVAGARETVTVSGAAPVVETLPAAISSVLDERAISELPLNGRRFSDLALLTPGVTQDPRSLTSATNGDLAFGGIRGFQTSFLVDGADNNNAFFSQARGRYRAPYQFSNEVIQEFRVSSNSYGPELGRAGGAVINVVTRSGGNQWHGSLFDYYRDGRLGAGYPHLTSKPPDRQDQFGFTLGGPIKRNRAFFFAGFDQHIFHVPTVVRFANGATAVVPQSKDYESTDQAQVFAAAASLTQMGGQFRSALVGNAAFGKLDFVLTPRHHLSARLSTSRYYGENNVFFDPASPVTTFAISENGQERVSTESAVVSLTSALSPRATSHLRLQFSRDLENSDANSSLALTKIYNITDGFGRSSILPRTTREHRLHLAETASLEGRRHQWKFGGDVLKTWIYNFFPSLFGGEYYFDTIKVNPFTFVPQIGGLPLTPLRAYAHDVPRYYIQNFGHAESHPDTTEYAWFVQDTIRVTGHFALTLGVRYDLQTFNTSNLATNPLWPDTGKVPLNPHNFAPRAGFAWTLGDVNPLVVRGGFGIFYTRIPQIYNSTIETDNGLRQTDLFLDNTNFFDRLLFPQYPNPLVSCAPTARICTPRADLTGHLTSDVSAFSPSFQTPYVLQSSLNVERELGKKLVVSGSYLYVHGEHLIRVRDVNLPPPTNVTYPVFDQTGTQFLGTYYTEQSFAGWQFTRTLSCPFPPCVNPLVRPVPGLGAINEFESAASSIYHGLTVSVHRRMNSGLYLRLAYTWAQAFDDVQDALVAGSPGNVQNSYNPQADWGHSVTDQRHRLVASWVYELNPFDRSHELLRRLFNHWKVAGIMSTGSGRPVNATIAGDANRDDNTSNDRLPGVARNSYTGPNYASTDLRLSRRFFLREHFKLELMAESFNLFNRDNKRVAISDSGFTNSAGEFVLGDKTIGVNHYPGYYTSNPNFLVPTSAYAPRKVQLAGKLIF